VPQNAPWLFCLRVSRGPSHTIPALLNPKTVVEYPFNIRLSSLFS
jgi:hypothetical protein